MRVLVNKETSDVILSRSAANMEQSHVDTAPLMKPFCNKCWPLTIQLR